MSKRNPSKISFDMVQTFPPLLLCVLSKKSKKLLLTLKTGL